jgi:hypothetical protein
MATKASLAIQVQAAQEKALQVVAKHGTAERLENIERIPLDQAHTRFPEFLAALQAELIAALAEMVEEQGRRISELEEAAKSATPKKSAKK